MSTKISYLCSVLEENEKRKKKETSVLGDTVNVNQPSAAERALMLSIRASFCTIVRQQALPNFSMVDAAHDGTWFIFTSCLYFSILCLLSVAFHKRCSEVGAVLPRGAARRQNFRAKVTKSVHKLSVFVRCKYRNSRFRKIGRDFVCHKQLLLEMVGILDDPPTLWTCIIWCVMAGQCSVPMSPSA